MCVRVWHGLEWRGEDIVVEERTAWRDMTSLASKTSKQISFISAYSTPECCTCECKAYTIRDCVLAALRILFDIPRRVHHPCVRNLDNYNPSDSSLLRCIIEHTNTYLTFHLMPCPLFCSLFPVCGFAGNVTAGQSSGLLLVADLHLLKVLGLPWFCQPASNSWEDAADSNR